MSGALTWACLGLFFYEVFDTRKGHVFVHLFSNLNYGCTKHSKRQNLVQKTDVQNLENILRIQTFLDPERFIPENF